MRRATLSVWLIVALAAVGPGCSGCGEPERPAQQAAGGAGGGGDAAAGTSPQTETAPIEAAGEGAHPLAAGWQREAAPEPAPAARALYRRALDRLREGDPAEAGRIFARLRADYADTRFARRLRSGGDPAATAALLGLAAAVGAATITGALQALESRAPAAPKAP